MAIKAVIFDIDGTLLDSVDLHADAWVAAFAHFGIAADRGAVRGQIGKGGDQLMPVFVPEERLAREGEAIETYRSDLFKREYLARVKPFPAVPALFDRLAENGIRRVLASSGKAAEVKRYIEILDLGDRVDAVVSSDDADRSKPHPDIFEAALKHLGSLDVGEVVVIGDTPYDAEAAAKAGLATIGVLCGGFPEAELTAAGCIAIYRDPQDLLAGYESSPIARDA